MLTELDRLAMEADPALVLEAVGMRPDPWQARTLRSTAPRLMLLTCRQAGKSTMTAGLAAHTAIFRPDSLVLLVSPSLRQSGELYRKVGGLYHDLGRPVEAIAENATSLHLANGSRVVSLPGSADTIRGYSGPALVVVDEAALCPDELFAALTPMLAVSGGRLVLLSTPMGQRGVFFAEWHDGTGWERVKVPATDCPRIGGGFLEEQRKLLGPRWFNQEFMCEFVATLDQVFDPESIANAFRSQERPLFGATA